MVDNDIIAEQQAIDPYKEIMEVAMKEGDPTTRFIFEQILEQEEEHHDFFTSLEQGQPKKTSKAKQYQEPSGSPAVQAGALFSSFSFFSCTVPTVLTIPYQGKVNHPNFDSNLTGDLVAW